MIFQTFILFALSTLLCLKLTFGLKDHIECLNAKTNKEIKNSFKKTLDKKKDLSFPSFFCPPIRGQHFNFTIQGRVTNE